jgi:asparagine synthase (glutamine-hydrolysing)
MCGINGILHFQSQRKLTNASLQNARFFAHRGPDDQGLFIDKNIGLGHRIIYIRCFWRDTNLSCLMIQDIMVYNGEIYNYKDFYRTKKNGYHIKTNSDTEVLLKLYQLYGKTFSSKWYVCICYLG